MYHPVIIDTETNGHQGEACEVIELAAALVAWEQDVPSLQLRTHMQTVAMPDPGGDIDFATHPQRIDCWRFCPKVGSTYAAMAVHHIADADLAGRLTLQPANILLSYATPFEADWEDVVLISHNVKFDVEALRAPAVAGTIDTLALSRLLWPDPHGGHSLGAMIYRLYGAAAGKQFGKYAHGAAADVYACYKVLQKILERIPAESRSVIEVARLSEAVQVPPVIGFGKHKGSRWRDIDDGYFRWYLSQADQDAAVVAAMEQEIRIRRRVDIRCPVCDGSRYLTEEGLCWLCDSCAGAGIVVKE